MLKLSASSMGTYESCPRKYYYQYIDKPDIHIPDWPHLEFGTTAHRVLELFHEYLIRNVVPPEKWGDLLRASFKKALQESRVRKKFHLIKEDLPYLKEIIQDYFDTMRESKKLPPVIHNEMDFNFKINGHTVRGFIDRIDRLSEEHFHVLDYKTSKNPKYLTSFQLLLYALAVKEVYPEAKKITGSYVLLKHKSALKTWEFTEKDYEDTVKKVDKIGTDINTETLWKKRPSILCNWCDFKSICQDAWTSDEW